MRIIVTGLLGNYSLGGVAWDYIQYLLGFRALGHDVWYLEDTGAWAYNPVAGEPTIDCDYNVAYLSALLADFGFGDRWIYRNEPDGRTFGIRNPDAADRLIAESDVLVNVSGACWMREATSKPAHRLFLDGDPMFTHAGLVRDDRREYIDRVRAHTGHFTFGLNIGQADCLVPTAGLNWKPTIQPVALDWWDAAHCHIDPDHPARDKYTTAMNWVSYEPVEFEGALYGQKDEEFLRFLDLPRHTNVRFLLAMGRGAGHKRPTERILQAGWELAEPEEVIADYKSYRDFLANSRGEWSVAKQGYVASRSGWFSCRSACYLAAGVPVVVQETGWAKHLPSGEGVLGFSTLDEAAAALEKIEANHDMHSQAARNFAREYLDAPKVCADLLEGVD